MTTQTTQTTSKAYALEMVEKYRKEYQSFMKAYNKRQAAVNASMAIEKAAVERQGLTLVDLIGNYKLIQFTVQERKDLDVHHSTIFKANKTIKSKSYGKQSYEYYSRILNA